MLCSNSFSRFSRSYIKLITPHSARWKKKRLHTADPTFPYPSVRLPAIMHSSYELGVLCQMNLLKFYHRRRRTRLLQTKLPSCFEEVPLPVTNSAGCTVHRTADSVSSSPWRIQTCLCNSHTAVACSPVAVISTIRSVFNAELWTSEITMLPNKLTISSAPPHRFESDSVACTISPHAFSFLVIR